LSPGFNDDATASASNPSPSDLPEHFYNELFNENSQTSTWTPGPPSASPSSSDTSSLSPSSPRKRTNNFTGSPETIPRKRNRPSLDGDGGSKPNQNKKENDKIIEEQNSMMQERKKEISETWKMIEKQDAWLAGKMGKDFDSVKSNFSEVVVNHPFNKKIKDSEQDVYLKASNLETFRKNRQNKDKRKEVIKLQKDVIKGQEVLLRWMKGLSQDLETRVKTLKNGLCLHF